MTWKHVTSEEEKEYGRFCLQHFQRLATRRPLAPLFHYTTGGNLIKIISSGSLWAGHMSCLNDSKELICAVDLLKSEITRALNGSASEEARRILSLMRDRMQLLTPEIFGAFVFCLSERPDDLSQWRAYGGGEGGYAIEFDPWALLDAVSGRNGYLMPVTYLPSNETDLFKDIVRMSETYYVDGLGRRGVAAREEWTREFVDCWLQNLQYLAPVFKDGAFEAEAEWRIIYLLRDEDLPNMQYVQKQSMIAKYVPLHFTEPEERSSGRLPIKRVVVGPSRHKVVSRISVGDLLRTKGYQGVDVSESKIPFQTT